MVKKKNTPLQIHLEVPTCLMFIKHCAIGADALNCSNWPAFNVLTVFSAIEVDSKLKNTANKKVLFYFNW